MMAKRWKFKINSFNILLVLVTLLLVEAECTLPEDPHLLVANAPPEDSHSLLPNALPEDPLVPTSPNTTTTTLRTRVYIGHHQIAHYFFGASIRDDSAIPEGVVRCLDNFRLFTCIKMLLLTRIEDVADLLDDPDVRERDLRLLHGLLTFQVKNATGKPETADRVDLDEQIGEKMRDIFRRRSLLVNLPAAKIEIEPSEENFLCFRYAIRGDGGRWENGGGVEGRKKSKGGMPMMMIVPPLIMLGLMPFTLASLKAMVMNAVMINMMALNGAIFMTIRNLVFGPRRGDNVKYVNYGYSKDRQTQTKRPVLIIHSPAAFVKQPPVHKKPTSGQQYNWASGHSHYDHETGNEYYFTREDNHNDYNLGPGGNGHAGVQNGGIRRRHDNRKRTP